MCCKVPNFIHIFAVRNKLYLRERATTMKKFIKYLLITLLATIGILATVVVLVTTVFREELVEMLAKVGQQEQPKHFVSEIPVESAQFAEDFESIHQQVVEHCSLYKQKGYDIDSLYTAFADRIGRDVLTKTDYALMVCEYFAALNIGHAWTTIYAYSAGQRVEVIEDRLFLSEPNDYLASCGFCDKDEIVGN